MDYCNLPSQQGNHGERIEDLEEKVNELETKVQNLELELRRIEK